MLKLKSVIFSPNPNWGNEFEIKGKFRFIRLLYGARRGLWACLSIRLFGFHCWVNPSETKDLRQKLWAKESARGFVELSLSGAESERTPG
jgi:hypothetical protein